MQCPVCTQKAQNLTSHTSDGVVVGCETCGGYRISGGAYYDLTKLHADRRMGALKSAKLAALHGWPMIDVRCVRAA
jgi:hypothetical protein